MENNNKTLNWIESLKVKNFKSFNNLNVNFKNNKLNLIYGDNGVGKSTFIDLFKFISYVWNEIYLISQLSNNLENNILNFNSAPNFLKYETIFFFKLKDHISELEPIEIEIIFNFKKKIYKYELIYTLKNNQSFVEYEKLSILNKDYSEKKIYFEKKFNKYIKINFLNDYLKDKNHLLNTKSIYSIFAIIYKETFNKLDFIKETFKKEEYLIIDFYINIINLFVPFHIENNDKNIKRFNFGYVPQVNFDLRINKKSNNYNDILNSTMKRVKDFESFVLDIDEKIISIELEKEHPSSFSDPFFDLFILVVTKRIGNENIKIPFSIESSGTQRYLNYFDLIKLIESDNKIIFFDEFGLHLHESLAINILEYIQNLIKDKNVQLFLTTHNTLLLNDKYIKISNKSKLILTKSKFTDVSLDSLENRNTRENNQDKFLRGDYGGKTINDDIYYDPSEK